MRNLEQHLTDYAGYHRDPRNVVTHFVGIPMIMVAVEVLLSRPTLATIASLAVTPALVVGVVSALFYFALDRRYGLLMTAMVVGCWWTGVQLAALSTASWLGWGIGLFVVGWVFQFVGHWYEGKEAGLRRRSRRSRHRPAVRRGGGGLFRRHAAAGAARHRGEGWPAPRAVCAAPSGWWSADHEPSLLVLSGRVASLAGSCKARSAWLMARASG